MTATVQSTPLSPPAAGPGRSTTPGRRVVDAPVRMFHALFGLCFALAYATGDSEAWRLLHVTLGYTMAGLLGFRLVWGLVGPRPARLALRWRRAAGVAGWLRATPRSLAQARAWLRQGEHLATGLAVVLLLALAVPVLASGWVVWMEWWAWAGDALAEVHEALASAMLALALAHVGLVLWTSLRRRRNQALPMLTGRLPGTPGPDLVQRDRRGLAALLLASVIGFVAWQASQAPQGLLPTGGWGADGAGDHAPRGDGHGDDDDD